MKKCFLLLLFISTSLRAGSFEGFIRYTIEYNGSLSSVETLLLPSAYVVYVKGNATLLKIEGGGLAEQLGEILYNGSNGKSYQINHREESFYELRAVPSDQPLETVQTDQKQRIAGFNCVKYILKKKGTKDVNLVVWATNELQIPLPVQGKSTGSFSLQFTDIVGTPLLIEDAQEAIKMKAEIISTTLPSGVSFNIPRHYTQKATP
jgi:hypothetical protein